VDRTGPDQGRFQWRTLISVVLIFEVLISYSQFKHIKKGHKLTIRGTFGEQQID
jgi:hypothetical protein